MKPTLVLALFPLLAGAQEPVRNPFAGDVKAAEEGRIWFRMSCAPCHGVKAQGGRAPDLTLGTYLAGDRDADLFRVISQGVPGSEMPGYSPGLGDDDIWRVVTYVRSVARRESPPTGDTAAGKTLFWGKGGCGACHVVGDQGGALGPELTRIGRRRSHAHLRDSVVAPNADLTPGYATITVVTSDGKKISGVQRGFDNFSAQLMDTSEKFHSFQRSDVRSATRELRSLMPDTYGRLFSQAEMNNLVAYLTSLRGEEKR